MNDQTQEQRKVAVMKTLAIIGFIAAIIITAWLAVQAVRLLPAAFGTLASLIEGRAQVREDLVIESNESIINSGKTLTVSWNTGTDGTYTFAYMCAEGVSATIAGARGDLSTIGCDTEITLPASADTIEVAFVSEKRRFTDVQYTIRYTPEEAGAAALERSGIVTVVNPTISAHGVAVAEEEPVETPETPSEVAPEPEPEAAPTYADLKITLLAIDTYDARSGALVPAYAVHSGDRVSVQFTVANVGTKISGIWYFDAALPARDAQTFLSAAQNPLAPGAGEIYTLQFDAGLRDGAITVTAYGGNDTRTTNNALTHFLEIR